MKRRPNRNPSALLPLKPTHNIDLSLMKRFNITERIRFEVAGSQQINSRNDLVPSSPLFGRFDQFYSSNSRFGQITAKIVF